MPQSLCRRDVPPQPRQGPDRGRIDAPAHTAAIVHITANKPVETVNATLNGKPVTVESTGSRTHELRLSLPPESSGRWSLMLTDRHGHNSPLMDFPVTVTPDRVPIAKILTTDTQPGKVRPTDRIPVSYEITDDFGVAAAEMIVTVDKRTVGTIPLPVSTARSRSLPRTSQISPTA